MDFAAVCELGRESVNSVNASVLGTVLRELVARYQQSRRAKLQLYDSQVRCSHNLEFRRCRTRKLGDDEGFESDEDARSTTSSCYLVEDHVFKGQPDLLDRSSPSTSTSTDSANSSGSSDSDDVDSRAPSPLDKPITESYKISDVIICHTEPRYLNTIAWVIKPPLTHFDTSSRLGKTGVENSTQNGLQVIVIRCKLLEDFKTLCSNYRDFSRRMKLDQYKAVNRKKPIVLSTIADTKDVKVALSEMKIARSSLLKASELSILSPKIMSSFKTDMKSSVSLSSLLKPEPQSRESDYATREQMRKKSSSLSNISPSMFNLLQRTDLDGMTHIEVSKFYPKSKIQKEIEGVIITDAESSTKKDLIRQRQCSSPLIGGAWQMKGDPDPNVPPMRPERKKYMRKKQASTSQTTRTYDTLPLMSDMHGRSKFYLPVHKDVSRHNTSQNSFPNSPLRDRNHDSLIRTERVSRKTMDSTMDRRRATSVGRIPTRAPMSYRYIELGHNNQRPVVVPSNTPEVLLRRRKSFDEGAHKSTLKSVIKSTKNKISEPKKVTFSAFATVQVVD